MKGSPSESVLNTGTCNYRDQGYEVEVLDSTLESALLGSIKISLISRTRDKVVVL